jgi:hypothetical protein
MGQVVSIAFLCTHICHVLMFTCNHFFFGQLKNVRPSAGESHMSG